MRVGKSSIYIFTLIYNALTLAVKIYLNNGYDI